jgi:hypothetical protein
MRRRRRKSGTGSRDADSEVERYKKAASDALRLLDWCIGHLTHNQQAKLARRLARNRDSIRARLD